MSDIATRLRQCAADIRRTPVRLDTWIPLQQEAADTIDALRERVAELEGKVTAIVGWLEREQPDVFRRGLWDALREVPSAGGGQ